MRGYVALFPNARHGIVAEDKVLAERIVDGSDADIAARRRGAVIACRREFYFRANVHGRCEAAGNERAVHQLLRTITQVHVFAAGPAGHEKRQHQTKYQLHISRYLKPKGRLPYAILWRVFHWRLRPSLGTRPRSLRRHSWSPMSEN